MNLTEHDWAEFARIYPAAWNYLNRKTLVNELAQKKHRLDRGIFDNTEADHLRRRVAELEDWAASYKVLTGKEP